MNHVKIGETSRRFVTRVEETAKHNNEHYEILFEIVTPLRLVCIYIHNYLYWSE